MFFRALVIALLFIATSAVARPTLLHAADAPPPPERDCADCPPMIPLAGGLGRLGEDGAAFIARIAPFALARTETTVAEWQACVAARACTAKTGLRWTEPNMPMTKVTLADAQAYADYLTRRTGRHYRLPSEAEWEYAARAGTQTAFPWGNSMEEDRAVCQHCDPRIGHGPNPVGSMAPNGWGLFDMNGNVWEWTPDCWSASHAGRPRDGFARGDGDCTRRVVKGGSWYFVPFQSRSASRAAQPTTTSSYDIGFRVARD